MFLNLNVDCESPAVSSNYVNEEIQKNVKEEKNDNIYCFAQEIINPHVSLKQSLKQLTLDPLSKGIFQKKPAESGYTNRVKFVQFKNDPVEDRWFAIKRPLYERNICRTLSSYEPNVAFFLKLRNHPAFMKVHGLVVKNLKKKDNRSVDQKPYLILEYIEGIPVLQISNLSPCIQKDLLSQLKDALLYMYDKGVCPSDAHMENVLITNDYKIKFIDFDEWVEQGQSGELASNLALIAYDFSLRVTAHRAKRQSLGEGADRKVLEAYLQELIDQVKVMASIEHS